MSGINKVIIIGNLGRDPDLKYTQQGTAVTKFPVATTETWTDKNTNQRQEQTEWHKIVVFGKQAENCEKYLSKGRQVYIEGKLKTSSYEKDGQTHYSTDIVASVVQFIGGRQEGNTPAAATHNQQPQGGGYQQSGPPQQGNQRYRPGPGEDDIPF